MPPLQLQPVLHPDGRHALLATQAVAEDETPVDQKEGEEVPANWLRLRHVEDQTVALLRLDLQTEVGVEPEGRHQLHRHPAVLPTEPGWKIQNNGQVQLELRVSRDWFPQKRGEEGGRTSFLGL